MFICDDCHKNKSHLHFFTSNGKCELCGDVKSCYECKCDDPTGSRKVKKPSKDLGSIAREHVTNTLKDNPFYQPPLKEYHDVPVGRAVRHIPLSHMALKLKDGSPLVNEVSYNVMIDDDPKVLYHHIAYKDNVITAMLEQAHSEMKWNGIQATYGDTLNYMKEHFGFYTKEES